MKGLLAPNRDKTDNFDFRGNFGFFILISKIVGSLRFLQPLEGVESFGRPVGFIPTDPATYNLTLRSNKNTDFDISLI